MAQLQRQLVVPFAPRAGAFPLSIENDPGFYSDGLAHLLLFPDVAATLATDVGLVRFGQSKVLDIAGGVLRVDDGDEATLERPVYGNPPAFRTLFAFSSTGELIPKESVIAHWDATALKVRLNRRCTCAIAYAQYRASARTILYTPQVQPLAQGGTSVTYGVIAAYYQGTLVVHQVDLPEFDQGEELIELYVRYSHMVTTVDGPREAPPNYPASGAYPDRPMVIELDGSVKFERVHEKGFITPQGRAFVHTPNVSIYEPYVGDAYTPTILNRVATLDPQKYPADIISRANDFIRSRGLGPR